MTRARRDSPLRKQGVEVAGCADGFPLLTQGASCWRHHKQTA